MPFNEHKYTSEDLHIGPNKSELVDGIDADGQWHTNKIIGKVYLDHSCNEWVIGGLDEVRALISDLQKIESKLAVLKND